MRCTSGKRIYVTETLANDALLEAHVQFDYRVGTGPVNFYKCDDCGNYHLTSKGPMHVQMATALANGTILKLKTSARWTAKLTGKK